MKLKGKPRGKGRPFPKGACGYRNPGGLPRVPYEKWRQRLSILAVDELAEAASDADCAELRLAPGSSIGKCVVRAMSTLAMRGDVSAARFLFETSEIAKVHLELHAEIDLTKYERALAFLDSIPDLPPLPAGEPS